MTELYPFVASVYNPTILQRGPWPGGGPLGITVHYSADRDLERVFRDGLRDKIGYHVIIDRDGKVHQTAYFNQRIDHAGDAAWLELSPNRHHIAVCVLSWGRLTRNAVGQLLTWSGAILPAPDAVARPDNLTGEICWWDACTPLQEAALKNVLAWLMVAYKIRPESICGHDECALPRGRKDDPGGALSRTMADLRRSLLPAPAADLAATQATAVPSDQT